MSQRHPIQNDCIMLVTTVTLERRKTFACDAFAREAIECLYRVQEYYPFFLYGFVIMHDHCHFLLHVPSPGTISGVMNRYKTGLASAIGKGPLWQRRFHLRIVENAQAALHYIHANPVRAGLVEISTDYPWSSASGKWDVTPLEW